MRTVLTKAQQVDWLRQYTDQLSHAWSTRGYGNSRFLDRRGRVVGKAGGCGYDRRGAALGSAIAALFPDELNTLARRLRIPGSDNTWLYGLHYSQSRKRAAVDGGCGFECMVDVLAMLGFQLTSHGGTPGSRNTGIEFFTLAPVARGTVRRIVENIKRKQEAQHVSA